MAGGNLRRHIETLAMATAFISPLRDASWLEAICNGISRRTAAQALYLPHSGLRVWSGVGGNLRWHNEALARTRLHKPYIFIVTASRVLSGVGSNLRRHVGSLAMATAPQALYLRNGFKGLERGGRQFATACRDSCNGHGSHRLYRYPLQILDSARIHYLCRVVRHRPRRLAAPTDSQQTPFAGQSPRTA